MVILVPGGPSRGEMPLTTGGGPMVNQIFFSNHKYFSARSRDITSRPELSAVQELKIRRPNYSDFSVKTMVIMKLLQQQNGNTVVVEKFKSEFYVEI